MVWVIISLCGFGFCQCFDIHYQDLAGNFLGFEMSRTSTVRCISFQFINCTVPPVTLPLDVDGVQ